MWKPWRNAKSGQKIVIKTSQFSDFILSERIHQSFLAACGKERRAFVLAEHTNAVRPSVKYFLWLFRATRYGAGPNSVGWQPNCVGSLSTRCGRHGRSRRGAADMAMSLPCVLRGATDVAQPTWCVRHGFARVFGSIYCELNSALNIVFLLLRLLYKIVVNIVIVSVCCC